MPKNNVIKKSALTPTALIAGGAGFIGSHLAESLLKKGARVIVLDNFNTGKDIYVNEFLKNPNFALFNIDINFGLPAEIESVDYIFHFAGLEEYLYDKDLVNLDSLLTNAIGTKNLLDLADRSSGKFLLASSIDVYEGRMSQLELQDYFGKTTMDENKYSMTEAKRFAEALVWEYKKKNDTDVRIVRLPEVYGPRMSLDASGSLGGYMKNVIEGHDLTIRGDGGAKEFYIYIDDAISGIVKALFNKNTKGNIYSLTDTKPMSKLEIAYVVKSVADRKLDIKFVDSHGEVKPYIKIPDTYNLKDLEWGLRVDLKSGVMQTLSWFGYAANSFSFKPGKLIADKKGETEAMKAQMIPVQPEELFSLSTVKEPPVPETPLQPEPTLPYKVISQGAAVVKSPSKDSIWSNIGKKFKKSQEVRGPGFFSKINKNYILIPLGAIIPALLIFLILPLLQFGYYSSQSLSSLNKLSTHTTQLDSENIAGESLKAYKSLTNSRRSLFQLKWIFVVLGKTEHFNTYDKLYSSLAYFSKAGTYVSSAVMPFESLWEVVRPDSDKFINPQDFNEAKLSLSNARNYVQLALADYKFVNKDYLPKSAQPSVDKYENYLKIGSESIDLGINIVADLPELLGANSTKKYLLLFQNSNEIRPTGGFIGSYGILEFDKGKIVNLAIDDIYNPDGQITIRDIKITPPEPIAVLLNEDRVYMRNANWDPDFPSSAATIEDLYYKVTGEEIDGVIAIDLTFVKNLMKATGPVFLTSYNEEITSENIYERTQLHSEFNYQDGSDQKKSFLTILSSKLLESLFSLQKEKMPVLLSGLSESFDQRHALVYLENNPLSLVLHDKKWDGAVLETDKDYLSIINANLGGTKANYYVKNAYEYSVSSKTRDGLLRAQIVMKYDHTGENNSWPGGPYTNYFRVLTPSGTKLTGAHIYNQDGGDEDFMQKAVISSEGQYTSYEYFFTLNPKETATVVIEYDLPSGLNLTADSKEYSLIWQKQAGTHGDSSKFVFSPPFGMNVDSYEGFSKIEDDKLIYEDPLNQDKTFKVYLK